MLVRDLREELELIDGECEVLVIDKSLNAYGIKYISLEPRFEKQTENRDIPLCIKIND